MSCSNKVSAGALPLNGAFKTLLIAARDGDRLPDYGVHSLRVHNTLSVPGAVPRIHCVRPLSVGENRVVIFRWCFVVHLDLTSIFLQCVVNKVLKKIPKKVVGIR